MSLYHDYRPVKFSEIIGNEATIKTIQNKIHGTDPPKAIILHGPRGCGKTTVARIISEELGCDTKSLDYVELDAVQTGGIDTAREIRQNMHYLPNNSKCRVWVIDEAQDSSSKFQAGLLKALESGPDHCYFILCTTDLNKIISTVKSRCTQWKFNLLDDSKIEQLLNWVIKSEERKFEKDVIEEIIKEAEGCPREALVILDTIFDLEPKEMIDAIQNSEMAKEVKELCQGMLRGDDWNKLRTIIKGLKGVDPERARQAIIYYMQAVALNNPSQAGQAALVFDCFKETVFYTGMPGISFAAYNTTL